MQCVKDPNIKKNTLKEKNGQKTMFKYNSKICKSNCKIILRKEKIRKLNSKDFLIKQFFLDIKFY